MSEQGPTVFNDRYELHRRLARGGMSDVYLARDLLLDRPVAVKVLFPEFAKDPKFVERFRREAKAAANLTHPNIVNVYDWGQQGETYFIVMEYVEGRSLAEIIRADGPLDGRRAAEIATDIAAALSFAHRNGVVHRDIKPGNVLVSPQGQVKVADFGIAQAMTSTTHLTQAGSVMGTATYFSPEQAQGKPVDPRSDLYSLGCVLYETLTGEPPFSGDTPVAIAYKHVQDTPVPPTQLNPRVPQPLQAITLQLLAKDPSARYASADDLRGDLARYLEGHKVAAVIPPAAAAGATVAAPAMPPPVVPPPRYDDYDDEPRGRSGVWLAVLVGLLLLLGLGLFFVANNLSSEDTGRVAVPDVVDLPFDEAKALLEEQELVVRPENRVNPDVEEGIVFDQDPPPGTRAEKGSTVTLLVSGGEEKEDVPDLTGLTRSAAESRLDTLGFIPNVLEEFSDTVPSGQVVSQEPAPGSQEPAGSVVTVRVSKGPAPVTIPDVTGQSSDQAQQTLLGAGLKVRLRNQSSETIPVDFVIGTDPPSGDQVAKDSTVTILVSTGPAPTTTTTEPTTTTTKATTTSSSSTSTSTSSTSSTTSTTAGD